MVSNHSKLESEKTGRLIQVSLDWQTEQVEIWSPSFPSLTLYWIDETFCQRLPTAFFISEYEATYKNANANK